MLAQYATCVDGIVGIAEDVAVESFMHSNAVARILYTREPSGDAYEHARGSESYIKIHRHLEGLESTIRIAGAELPICSCFSGAWL